MEVVYSCREEICWRREGLCYVLKRQNTQLSWLKHILFRLGYFGDRRISMNECHLPHFDMFIQFLYLPTTKDSLQKRNSDVYS